MTQKLQQLTFNLAGKVREAVLEDRRYWVIPMVIHTVGVHNGSDGPLYWSAEKLSKRPESWDHKPLVVYHPTDNSGTPISACTPTVMEAQKVGLVLNTVWEGKLRSEAWLDRDKTEKVDKRIIDAIVNNRSIPGSSGVYTEDDGTPGEFGGTKYNAMVTNLHPDHFAILPDQLGADPGAGLNVNNLNPTNNQKSWGDIMHELWEAIQARFGYSAYLEDVFDSWLVYEFEDKCWKIGYTSSDTETTLTGTPVEVFFVSHYKTVDGNIVGNTSNSFKERIKSMDRTKQVDGLIANSKGVWTEAERKYLTNMPNEMFDKVLKTNTAAPPIAPPPEPTPTPAPAPQPEPKPGQAAPLTANQYIEQAPPEVRRVLASGIKAYDAQRERFIGIITANKKNKFTAEFLRLKDNDELQHLAELALPEHDPNNPTNNSDVQMFIGAQGGFSPPPVVNQQEPLLAPGTFPGITPVVPTPTK